MTEAQLRSIAAQFGYVKVGFCAPAPFGEWAARLTDAHKAAQHLISSPLEAVPWARAIAVAVAPYHMYKTNGGPLVSAYYVEYNAVHSRGEAFVRELNRCGVQAESVEIPLKPAVARSGLGGYGKNTLIRLKDLGSCAMLRGVALGEGFEHDGEYPSGNDCALANCGMCRRCVNACPTGALDNGKLDYKRCLRAHMFQGPPVPIEFRELMGGRLLGCEECLRACPYNAYAFAQALDIPSELMRILDIKRALAPDTRSEYMHEFGSLLGWNLALPNRVLAQAIIVAANLGMRELRPLIEPLTLSKSAAVSEHARWAMDKLKTIE